jgi:hypothetical protein
MYVLPVPSVRISVSTREGVGRGWRALDARANPSMTAAVETFTARRRLYGRLVPIESLAARLLGPSAGPADAVHLELKERRMRGDSGLFEQTATAVTCRRDGPAVTCQPG